MMRNETIAEQIVSELLLFEYINGTDILRCEQIILEVLNNELGDEDE